MKSTFIHIRRSLHFLDRVVNNSRIWIFDKNRKKIPAIVSAEKKIAGDQYGLLYCQIRKKSAEPYSQCPDMLTLF